MSETGTAQCAYCGKWVQLKGDRVPYHDYPPPCRQVCPGSKMAPREPGATLEKDVEAHTGE